MTDPDETANLVDEIMGAYREHAAAAARDLGVRSLSADGMRDVLLTLTDRYPDLVGQALADCATTRDRPTGARARLADLAASAAPAMEEHGMPSSCPSCGTGALYIDRGLADGLGDPVDRWRCMNCGHEWETPNARAGLEG